MSSDIAIKVEHLSKCYQIYEKPGDRLKQFLFPRLWRLIGNKSGNYFREFWALKDISFQIKKGETLGIIGRNGSGKSTLLQIICGTLNPTAGNVRIEGRVAALLELGSGFNPEFTGRENVYLNASILGLNKEETDARFVDILNFADIGDFIDQPVKTYSSGMMVRLAFSVIAHVDADILVIDEALAVGDAFFTQKCMRFLRNFMKNGTVLFVSHDTSSVKNLCNYSIWLEKGQVMQEGSPKDVCELYLEAFFEAQQGKSSTTTLRDHTKISSKLINSSKPIYKDQRLEYINHSNLRNDLKIFKFDGNARSFGKGGARVLNAEFLDEDGAPLTWVVGGEVVTVRIVAVAHVALNLPIIGFTIKDRLGQELFGDNTFVANSGSPISVAQDEMLSAEFTFIMPILPSGIYSLNAAIADGTQQDHIQHHWIHDALMIRSESSSVATGLIGIPMHSIKLFINNPLKESTAE